MFRRAFLAGFFTAAAKVAQGQTGIRVDVRLVMVDVQVTDVNGRSSTALTKDDFDVLEDGSPRPIAAFESTHAPYSIQLLLDRSTRMEEYWPLFEQAIERFLASLKPQDQLSIGAFDERSREVDLLLDWRSVGAIDAANIRVNPAILGLNSPPSSRFPNFRPSDPYRALEWAAERLGLVRGRKGIVFLGDGRPSNTREKQLVFDGRRYSQLIDGKNDREFANLERRIMQANTRLDAIVVGTDLNPRDSFLRKDFLYDDPLIFAISVRARLEHLANLSGGRVVFPRKVEDILPLYEAIGTELGTSYTLGFPPISAPKEGVFHRIEVRSRAGLKIQQSRSLFQ